VGLTLSLVCNGGPIVSYAVAPVLGAGMVRGPWDRNPRIPIARRTAGICTTAPSSPPSKGTMRVAPSRTLMLPLNRQFDLIRQSATVAMADRILALKASGKPIIGLQVGDPDFGTPPAVLDSAIRAMQSGLTHYGPSRGYPELRQAIAAKLLRDEGVAYDPEAEILVTHGGIHAYYTALLSILTPETKSWCRIPPGPPTLTWPSCCEVGSFVCLHPPSRTSSRPWRPGIASSPEHPGDRAELPVQPDGSLSHAGVPWAAAGLRPGQRPVDRQRRGVWQLVLRRASHLRGGLRGRQGADPAGDTACPKTYAMTGWRVGYLAAPAAVIGECTEG